MQNQIIKIVHNNEEISVRRDSSLEQLLQSKKLSNLSIQEWYDLLIKKDGIVPDCILIEILKHKILTYDKSKEVNSFVLKGVEYWFDKATRVSLSYLASCVESKMDFVLGNEIITISKEEALKFLSDLEVYAQQCYLATHKNLLALNQIKSFEDIINFEYINKYPDKINFI